MERYPRKFNPEIHVEVSVEERQRLFNALPYGYAVLIARECGVHLRTVQRALASSGQGKENLPYCRRDVYEAAKRVLARNYEELRLTQ